MQVIFQCRKYDHVTPLLWSLHWLPVEQRIEFKLLIITFKALKGLMPPYICELVTPYVHTRTLSSADQSLLCQPKFNLKTFGARSFSISAPTLWNSMPFELRKIDLYSIRNILRHGFLILVLVIRFELFGFICFYS